MSKRFITVSIELLHDKNLTANQKFILAEIEQLSELEKGCIAQNKHFADLTGIAKESVSRCIKDLENKGYISTEIVNGSRNHIRTITINKMLSPPKQNVKPPLTKHQETKENITINKTINKVIYSFKESFTGDISDEILLDFINYRKEIKKEIKTSRPLTLYVNELINCLNAGYDKTKVIDLMKNKEWQSLKLDWVKKELTLEDKSENKGYNNNENWGWK